MSNDKKLLGWEHRVLRDALTHAFNAPELNQLARLSLDVKLADVVNTAQPYNDVAFDFIDWADRRGRLLEVFEAARGDNPANGSLARAVAAVFHANQRFDQLQAIVNAGNAGDAFATTTEFITAFSRSEAAVCRIECPEDQPWGTGWRIGKQLVITNHHVWEACLKSGAASESCAAFNYRITPDKKLAFAKRMKFQLPDPIVVKSVVEDLDFVLLRIAGDVEGIQAVDFPGAPPVTPLTPKNYAFKGTEPAIILQHPTGLPLRVAWGLISDLAQNILPQRIAYKVNTLPGSSGSPVFLNDWQPVALHSQQQDVSNNAGIPMSLILPHIQAHLI